MMSGKVAEQDKDFCQKNWSGQGEYNYAKLAVMLA